MCVGNARATARARDAVPASIARRADPSSACACCIALRGRREMRHLSQDDTGVSYELLLLWSSESRLRKADRRGYRVGILHSNLNLETHRGKRMAALLFSAFS